MTQAARKKLTTIIVLTLIIEATCLILRYGFSLESTTHTASTIGVLTFGLRIHHGYIGIMFLLLTLSGHAKIQKLKPVLTTLGWPLFASDFIHHFLILWPLEGTPHFDLFYPT